RRSIAAAQCRSFLEPEHICCRGLQHLPQWYFRWAVREDQLCTQRNHCLHRQHCASRSDILLRDYSSGCGRSGECVLESGPSRGSYSLSIGTAKSFGAQMGPNVFPNSTSTIFRRSERQGSCFRTASMLEGRSLVKIVFRVVQIVRDNQHGAEAARVNGCSRQVPCCFP